MFSRQHRRRERGLLFGDPLGIEHDITADIAHLDAKSRENEWNHELDRHGNLLFVRIINAELVALVPNYLRYSRKYVV